MKHDDLRAIAHNIADSLASGIGLLIGVYETEIFKEAARSPERHITVNFLNGTTTGAIPSPSLAKAISLYSKALPDLCSSHKVSMTAFQKLSARFSVDSKGQQHVCIEIQDQKNGRVSKDEYFGAPLKRKNQ
jgi:hypothetical protein